MSQAIPKLVTFEDFAAWRPEGGRYELHDGEYQVTQFRDTDIIVSPTFPELNLTAEQIFQAGGLPSS
jgi:Uma2 family endonuclease